MSSASLLKQRVAKNGAADVPYVTLWFSCNIVVLLGTLWFVFYVAYMLYVHIEPCQNRLTVP